MPGNNLVIVGATGLVGRTFLKVLEERRFPVDRIKLLASSRSAGNQLEFKGDRVTVQEFNLDQFEKGDIALFSAGADLSKSVAPILVSKGVTIIDNSSAWRMEDSVPLVVPEVNPLDVNLNEGIIANPNCSTIQLVVALNPLTTLASIDKLIVCSYQATSGAGASALEELKQQSKDIIQQNEVSIDEFPHQIAFNVIPQIDKFEDFDFTKEEWKLVNETRKIFHNQDMLISATCVRVPVAYGHSEAVHMDLDRKISVEDAKNAMANGEGLKIIDNPNNMEYPLAINAEGYSILFGLSIILSPSPLAIAFLASSTEIFLSKSMCTASLWPYATGTLTQVADISMSWLWNIFRVSLTNFHSSFVKSKSSNLSIWGITLNAI
jgi:aspartate-semialdehyde dehydrogenase